MSTGSTYTGGLCITLDITMGLTLVQHPYRCDVESGFPWNGIRRDWDLPHGRCRAELRSPMPCSMYITKANPEGLPELYSVPRHMDPDICPLGALTRGIVQHSRHHKGLDFSSARLWMLKVLFPGQVLNEIGVTPRNMQDRVKKSHDMFDIDTEKKMHSLRVINWQIQQQMGVPVPDIKISQNRSIGSMDPYTIRIPVGSVLARSGVGPNDIYACWRGDVKPPASLRNEVIRWLAKETAQLEVGMT